MRPTPSSQYGSADPSDRAAQALISSWTRGEAPDVEALWKRFDPHQSLDVLAALVKVDLQCRFHRGERPEVAEYLDRFPALKEARERVVSLVYEEFFLRERGGEAPDVESFCDRYEPWRDSVASQLRYHMALSQIVAVPAKATKFPSPGDRFSSFRLNSVLGEGGSARVFLAMDELLGNRVVALKVSADGSDEPTIQGRLDHAHIVPVLSVYNDSETGLRGLSMPYRAGLPLDQVIRRVNPASRPKHASSLREVLRPKSEEGPPPWDHEESAGWSGFPARGTYAEGVAWVVSVIAKALAYAHAHQVLHRDVKPANVLLTARDGPQLLDFNLAHSTHSPEQAEEALRGGTLPYMAPEQLEAFRDPEQWEGVGEAADIFSVGLLLRELLTGERPEAPRQDIPLPWAIRDLLERRSTRDLSARGVNPDVPHALDAILLHCLATRPADRYPSAAALGEDLRRFLDHLPLRHAANPSRAERMANWLHRSKTRLLLAAGAAAISGLFALALVQGGNENNPTTAPESALEHMRAGLQHRKKGDVGRARREYETALKLDPILFKAHWDLAVLDFRENRTAQCIKHYQIASRLIDQQDVDPSQAGAFFHDFASLLLKLGKWDEARKMFQRAIAAHPHPSMHSAYMGLAIACGKLEEYDLALTSINKAIELASNSASNAEPFRKDLYFYRRAQVFLNQALLLQKAGGEFPKRTDALAKAEADVRKAQRSAKEFEDEERLDLETIPVSILIAQGDIASELNHYDESVSLFEKARERLKAAIKLNGRNPKVQALQKDIHHRIEADTPKRKSAK